jgi:S1-C subfamily serine protease
MWASKLLWIPVLLAQAASAHAGSASFGQQLAMQNANEADRQHTIRLRVVSAAGLQVEQLTSQLRRFFGIRDGTGVLVRHVRNGSPAAKAGFRAGDVIVEVGGQPVWSSEQVVNSFRSKQGKKVAVGVVRAKKIEMVAMDVAP